MNVRAFHLYWINVKKMNGDSMRPLALITNDDGISSPGIIAAAEAVDGFADLLIVAPVEQKSHTGRSIPNAHDLGELEQVEVIINDRPVIAFGVYGTPAAAVALAVLTIAPRPIALCVSGINYGENIGFVFTGSGTVGAAIEASSCQIPALAVGLEVAVDIQKTDDFYEQDFSQCKRAIKYFGEKLLTEGLPGDIRVLNINVPSDANDATEYRITKQSAQNYYEPFVPEGMGMNTPLQLREYIAFDEQTIEPDSDVFVLAVQRCISVTPLSGNLTALSSYTL